MPVIVHACVYLGQRQILHGLLSHSPSFPFHAGSVTKPQAWQNRLGWLTSEQACRVFLPLFPQPWGYRDSPLCPAFTWVKRIQPQEKAPQGSNG